MLRRVALAVAALIAWDAAGQEARRPISSPAEDVAAGSADETSRREEALRAIEQRIAEGAERDRLLSAELADLRGDRLRLSAALVEGAARSQAAEIRATELEAAMGRNALREAALARSLDGRLSATGEVLAALQRLNVRGPPALLLRPGDVRSALRSASLLGATIGGLSDEARRLVQDLGELAEVRARLQSERGLLARELDAMALDQARLAALVGARQREIAAGEADLAGARAQAQALGRDARSLRDLLDRLAAELATARREADDAKRAADARLRETRDRFAAAAARGPIRLAPRLAFADARGQLGRPAAGPVVRDFGAPDGQGGTTRGIVIGARTGAVVISPCEGSVSYAGPFRSYGRLLIIDAGGGYYLLLAGMDQINVEVGQVVLAGEPVGRMGRTASLSAALGSVEVTGPALYVEFRKDGGSIDPGPWWTKSQGEKVRG